MSTERTSRWGLSILGPGDSMADDGFKYPNQDRKLMDRLLEYAVEGHHHTGIAGTDQTPNVAPNLFGHNTGGAIPAGLRFYYAFTVVDELGNESAASPAAFVDTPPPVSIPNAPTLSWLAGTGGLEPGTYTYVLSAYKAATSLETKAVNSAVITVLGTNPSNQVTLTLPALPAGADGFNVYRKSPTGMHFLYLDSTTDSTFVDDGSIEGDCDRSLPNRNTSNSANRITVTFPGATPTLPDGWSWRIFRTDDPDDWGNSLLIQLSPDGGATAVVYEDVGTGTMTASPPSTSQLINAPQPILLTDMAEVQGTLPPGRNIVPAVVTFQLPGLVEVGDWPDTWVCEYDIVDIVHCRAYLGDGFTPASTDVIVDVLAYRPGEATPSWQSIYENGPDRPRVTLGQQIGDPTVPIVRRLTLDDALAVQVDQAGGGATPTDYDLTVSILMLVRSGSTEESYVFGG